MKPSTINLTPEALREIANITVLEKALADYKSMLLEGKYSLTGFESIERILEAWEAWNG